MRLLDRYLLRELLIPLAYCLGGFIIFYSAFDLIFKLHTFQDKQMTAGDCIQYYLVTAPQVFVLLAPVALLLALLFTVTNHARHHEFTAIRAAGISLWRISTPYLCVGTLLSGFVFFVNEFWAPQSDDKVKTLYERRISTNSTSFLVQNLNFRNVPADRFWSIREYNTKTAEMKNPTVIWGGENGSHRNFYAESAIYTNSTWMFFEVEEWPYKSRLDTPSRSKHYDVLEMRFSETPDMIRSQIKANQINLKNSAKNRMSLMEIFNYMRLNPKLTAEEHAKMMTQLQSRLAEPFTCLMVVLIAIPFGAPSGRRNVFVGVASSIVICFVYFILQQVSRSMGSAGILPPLIAAWSPNVLFGLVGIILTMRVR